MGVILASGVATLIKPTVLALSELWWRLHPELRGLLLAMFVVSAVAGFLVLPIGSPQHTGGIVDHLGEPWGGRSGSSFRLAFVRLPDRRVTVILPYSDGLCAAGRPMRVVRQQHLWGVGFQSEQPPCALNGPTPSRSTSR